MASRHQHDFSGCSVVVTGASRGIGLAVAAAFASAGADLLIIADDPGVSEAASILTRRSKRLVRGALADVTNPGQVSEVFSRLETIDVLINNAGLERVTPLGDPDSQAAMARVLDINVTGMFTVTQHALDRFPASGGAIVNTASIWGRVAEPGFSAYVASKHAVIGLTRTLAMELGSRGIRVNAVCPGRVRTLASMNSLAAMARTTGRSEDDLLAEITAKQVLPGLMEPEDVVDPYLFLASCASRNITGQAIMVDRGEVMA